MVFCTKWIRDTPIKTKVVALIGATLVWYFVQSGLGILLLKLR